MSSIPVTRRRFTVDDYHRMGEAGVFRDDDRLELIEGEIIEMSPIGSRHAGYVNRLTRLFGACCAGQALLSVRNPVRLSQYSEPQPDLMLLKPRPDDYADGHPAPHDVLLAIEVCDTTSDYDRGVKAPLYAASGVAELWIVDVAARVLEVYTGAGPRGYGHIQRCTGGERVSPMALPGCVVAFEDVFP